MEQGKSLAEADLVGEAKAVIAAMAARGAAVPIPVDVVCAQTFAADAFAADDLQDHLVTGLVARRYDGRLSDPPAGPRGPNRPAAARDPGDPDRGLSAMNARTHVGSAADPIGNRINALPRADMPPAISRARVPAPQKLSNRLGPLIAPPVSCASIRRLSGRGGRLWCGSGRSRPTSLLRSSCLRT